MKSNQEFIDSVYRKVEIKQKEKQKKTRKAFKLVTTFAVCFVLCFGVARVMEPELFVKEMSGGAVSNESLDLASTPKATNGLVGMSNDTCKAFDIVVEGEVFASALELFWEDDEYEYYFPCMMSGAIKVICGEGELTLKEALEEGVITVSDLDIFDIKYYAEAKEK